MKCVRHIRVSLSHLPAALILAPFAFMVAVMGEALQHSVELMLGMYASHDAFIAAQGSPLRLSFGILKAVLVLTTSYFVCAGLHKTFGPYPERDDYRGLYFRKMWDPRGTTFGMIGMLAVCAPLIALHMMVSNAAILSTSPILWLSVDSLIIGMIALAIGTSIWATDMMNAEHAY